MESFLGPLAKMRKATISFVVSVSLFVRQSGCLSVCPSTWKNWTPTGRILMKLDMSMCRKSARKIQDSLKSDKNNGHFKWRPISIFRCISLSSS